MTNTEGCGEAARLAAMFRMVTFLAIVIEFKEKGHHGKSNYFVFI